jgi:uncharacterized Ntn-hydrolase superfamily protein
VTFALLGRDRRHGQLGVAVTTSDLAVGARVPFARAGLGVAVTQHRTDPRLGPRMLDLLASGCSPQEAADGAAASTAHRGWRQLAVLGTDGRWGAVSGADITPVAAVLPGDDALVVGNMLVDEGVAPAIRDGFAQAVGRPLAERLVAGLQAGLDAGGETGTLRSAALLVVEREPFPLVDLRVDDAADPLGELARLWRAYAPWTRDFVRRALDPDAAAGAPDPGEAGQ